MADKHTRGPWCRDKYGHVVDAAGREVVFRGVTTLSCGSGERMTEAEANADIVAAAPELLEALRVAEQFMEIASDWSIDEAEINGEMRSTYDWLEKVRAAIAKATGSASHG